MGQGPSWRPSRHKARPVIILYYNYYDLWKYVDDSSLSESVCSDGSSNLQKYVDAFNGQKSTADGFQINESKCKEFVYDFFCVGVVYSGEYDACDVTLSVYPHRASLKNMPGHGGNRTYDLWNTSPTLCQLSYAVRTVRVSDISEQNLVPSIPM